jgi:hypothetical protein
LPWRADCVARLGTNFALFRQLFSLQPVEKKFHATASPADIRFTHEPGCRGLSGAQMKPSQARLSLLASIHKKTLAGFSD